MTGLSPEILAPIRTLFFQECEELLGELESGLLAMHKGDHSQETLNSVFRAVHSIKGSAGAFHLDALVTFAHDFESALSGLRSRRIQPDTYLVKLLLQASDIMADLVRYGRDDVEAPADHGSDIAAALSTVLEPARDAAEPLTWLDAESAPDPFDDELGLGFTPIPISIPTPRADVRDWTIVFRPESRFYAKGGEPLPLLRELQRLGALECRLDPGALPALPDLDPERAYVGWSLRLTTAADEAAIREVFAFVEGDCELHVSEAAAPSAPDHDHHGAAASPAPAATPTAASVSAAPLGESIRIDVERLDRVVNLVGELLMNQSLFNQRLAELGYVGRPGSELPTEQMEQLTRELQDSVMALRAQPVKVVFRRMPRLVRELEEITGKSVDLEMVGEGVEIDRTVVERLVEPLTHLVRNAVDHGIEAPKTRLAMGKPPRGALRLSAAHRNGRIVIELADDGAGIDRARVRARAIERGLIAPDAVLSDADIDSLIFAPGFSTADVVSDLSGRGVGMDVVKRAVEALGGRIAVASTPGEGSTFTFSLPLTLAVLDGMAIDVAGQQLIVPLTAVVEAVLPQAGEIRRLGPDANLLWLRDTHLPVIDLGRHFGYRTAPCEPGRSVALVIEDDRGGRVALLVDEVLGQRQVVIRSLEQNYRPVDGVAAAAIGGDGRVVLIVDVHAVCDHGRRDAQLELQP